MQLFERTFELTECTTVLDVGGSPLIWQFATTHPRLTFLNLPPAMDKNISGVNLVGGDGRLMPFGDQTFDIVFSNSTIEHVGTQADQKNFADEVTRVGRRFWVQTPNRYFPMELHLMLPIVHYLPRRWQRLIVTRFTGWEFLVAHTEVERMSYIEHCLTELRLLSAAELHGLFPDAVIARERMFGWPKSLIAFKA